MPQLVPTLTCKTCGSALTSNVSTPSSPTPHLYRTLQAPDPIEGISIRKVLTDAKRNLLRLDDEITHAQVVLDELCQQRRSLLNFTMDHDAFLAPIRQLPSEILTHIFTLCMPEHETSSFESWRVPLLIGQVCVGWRKAALSTQKLWSSITVAHTKGLNESLTKVWLSRAISSPLAIRLDYESYGLSIAKRMRPVIAVLVQYCDRWKRLDIRLHPSMMSYLDPVRHRLPWLESLRICDQDSSEWPQKLDLFEHAPRLRSIRLPSGLSHPMLKVPWHQLTELHASFATLTKCLETLRLAPNLVKCTMDCWDYPIQSHDIVLRFPHMRSFHVFAPSCPMEIFRHVELPILHDIYVVYRREQYASGSWLSQQPFLSLLSHSSHTLRILKVKGLYRQDSVHVEHCLRATPSLIKLSLRGSKMWLDSNLLRLLTRHSSPDANALLVPDLEVLVIGDESIDPHLCAVMIQSRRQMADNTCGARLQRIRVELRWTANWPLYSLESLRKCREEGMDISIIDTMSNRDALRHWDDLT